MVEIIMRVLLRTSLLFLIFVSAIPLLAVDARWVTTIRFTPAALTTGVAATAEASFRIEGAGGIDNLRVTGGVVGGDTMYDRTWAHIGDGATRTATFSGTPGDPGTFTIFFQIDPDGTSPDSNRTNNRLEVSVTIAPGLLPNLANVLPGPSWTPEVFAAGDILTIRYLVANVGDASARDFLVGLRVDGAIVARNPHTGLVAHAPFIEGSFTWLVICGADVAVVIDCGNDVSESDETDNIGTNPRLSTCAVDPVVTNLTVEKLKIDSGGNTIPEGAALYFRGGIQVSDNTATNVKVRAGIVGGAVLFEKTFPMILRSSGQKIEFKYCLPKGRHTLYIEVDPDNTIAESNERDNRATSKFWVVGKEGSPIRPIKKP